MNLSNAIETKQGYQYKLQDAFLPELIEADNLSIEAMKHWEAHRQECPICFRELLPGETED